MSDSQFYEAANLIGSDTETTQKTLNSETENMRFPKRIRYRGQVLATICATPYGGTWTLES